MAKYTIEDVKKYLEENDKNQSCTLLSNKYVNTKTPLLFKCNICGETFYRTPSNLFKERFRCEKCGERAGAKRLKYTSDYVKKIIKEQRNYTMIGEYINAGTPVLCRCQNGHEFPLIFSHYLKGHSGCKQCANEKLKESNHWNWQGGGHQETVDYFRHRILPWKQACLALAEFKCDITGENTNNLIVHHLSNFSDIMYSASKDLGIPIKNYIADYTEEEREKLASEILARHDINNGVVITRDIHNLFHSIYGKINNTKEQYLHFKEDYLNGKYIYLEEELHSSSQLLRGEIYSPLHHNLRRNYFGVNRQYCSNSTTKSRCFIYRCSYLRK